MKFPQCILEKRSKNHDNGTSSRAYLFHITAISLWLNLKDHIVLKLRYFHHFALILHTCS